MSTLYPFFYQIIDPKIFRPKILTDYKYPQSSLPQYFFQTTRFM